MTTTATSQAAAESINWRNRRRDKILGKTFNRLTVIAPGRAPSGEAAWLCLCVCGNQTTVDGWQLKNGRTKSCGCWNKESSAARGRANATHGWRNSQTYKSWQSMLDRCRQERRRDWGDYGGRGISVCERWHKFENFLSDMGPRPERLSLDRIDVDGNYEPGNCRWATSDQQANNRRTSAYAVAFGERKTVHMWSIDPRCKVRACTLYWRIRHGFDPEQALTKPANRKAVVA